MTENSGGIVSRLHTTEGLSIPGGLNREKPVVFEGFGKSSVAASASESTPSISMLSLEQLDRCVQMSNLEDRQEGPIGPFTGEEIQNELAKRAKDIAALQEKLKLLPSDDKNNEPPFPLTAQNGISTPVQPKPEPEPEQKQPSIIDAEAADKKKEIGDLVKSALAIHVNTKFAPDVRLGGRLIKTGEEDVRFGNAKDNYSVGDFATARLNGPHYALPGTRNPSELNRLLLNKPDPIQSLYIQRLLCDKEDAFTVGMKMKYVIEDIQSKFSQFSSSSANDFELWEFLLQQLPNRQFEQYDQRAISQRIPVTIRMFLPKLTGEQLQTFIEKNPGETQQLLETMLPGLLQFTDKIGEIHDVPDKVVAPQLRSIYFIPSDMNITIVDLNSNIQGKMKKVDIPQATQSAHSAGQ